MDVLIGCSSAAQLLGVSQQLVRYRARTGKIRVARHSPMQFSMRDIIALRGRMPIKKPGRPTQLDGTLDALATKYARISANQNR